MMFSIEKFEWLRIARTKNIGPATFAKIITKYSFPKDAIQYLTQSDFKVPELDSVMEEVYKLEELGGRMLFCMEEAYPKLLKECPDMPPFLSCIGNIELLKKETMAIIGSRNSSIYGNKIAHDLAEQLVENGYIIASGMASGIDTNAHKGAKNSTVAVLAGGVDVLYPASNQELYNRLKVTGLVISEAPIGTPISPLLFHARNRIIAGMSLGTIIVEGAKNSGSMITVECAQSYHRDIFAVPGSPLDPRSYVSNKVIQNGAYLINSAEDVLDILKPKNLFSRTIFKPNIKASQEPSEGLHRAILEGLSTKGISINDLHTHIGVPIGDLRAALIDLELDNKINVTAVGEISLSIGS